MDKKLDYGFMEKTNKAIQEKRKRDEMVESVTIDEDHIMLMESHRQMDWLLHNVGYPIICAWIVLKVLESILA